MRFNKPYIQLNKVLGYLFKNELSTPNPFSGFDVFEGSEDAPRFGLSDDDLMQLFLYDYQTLKIFEPLPPIGTEYLGSGEVSTVETEADQYEYVWRQFCLKIYAYLAETYEDWEKKTAAYCAAYKPLENYNMTELAGGSSLTSGVTSSSGTHKTTGKVAPFDGETFKNESEVTNEQTANASSGFSDANKSLTFDTLTTPQGNSTSVSKLTRSGNIGVMSTQDMLNQELSLRDKGFIKNFLKEVARVSLLSEWK